ncbi:hypothetical protein CL614_02735 [archaeon]|nr:hypothetical protein [archaeon]
MFNEKAGFESEKDFKLPRPVKSFLMATSKAVAKSIKGSFNIGREVGESVEELMKVFDNEGIDIFLVGEAVRDIITYKEPNDFDFITLALPDDIELWLKKLKFENINNGFKKYKLIKGVRTVVSKFEEQDKLIKDMEDNGSAFVEDYRPMVSATKEIGGKEWRFEISTYSKYHEPKVIDSKNVPLYEIFYKISDEMKNKDFTINSLLMDYRGWVYDYFGGELDLRNNCIRVVGDPIERFKSEPRMMLRAVDLMLKRKFRLESKTKAALKEVVFEQDREMSPNVKRELLTTILKNEKGFDVLYEYGFITDFLTLFGGEMNEEDVKRYSKIFIMYQKLSDKNNRWGIRELLYYILSKHIKPKLKNKSVAKLIRKQDIDENFATIIGYYKPFRLNERNTHNSSKMYLAGKELISGKRITWNKVIKIRELFLQIKRNELLTEERFIKAVNKIFIPYFSCIAILEGMSVKEIRKRITWYLKIYTKTYEYYFSNIDKVVKHLEVCYSLERRKAKPLVMGAITRALMNYSSFTNWETLIDEITGKLEAVADIPILVGLKGDEYVDLDIDYEFMIESCIHNSQSDIKRNLEDEIEDDKDTALSSHVNFDKYIMTDLPKDGVSFLKNLRKKASLIIQGKLNEEGINQTINKYSKTLNEVILEDSPFIKNSKAIEDYRGQMNESLNQFQRKSLESLRDEYSKTMYYYHETFCDSLAERDRQALMSARDYAFDLFKDKKFYWNFFSANIRVDDIPNSKLRLEDIKRMIDMKTYRDVDWFILGKNQMKHNKIVYDLKYRMDKNFAEDDRIALITNRKEYQNFMQAGYDNFLSKRNAKEIKLLEECRRVIFNYDLKSFSKMFKNNLATQKGKHKVFILDWVLFGDAPSGGLIKIDYLRSMLRNDMNQREKYNYQTIFREYQNIVVKGINSKIFGSTLENINDDYYEYFTYQFVGAMADFDVASSERVQTFLNNKLWWHCENIYGVLPIYYKQNKWFVYENTIIDKEGKLIIPCSVANSIYSIVSLYGGASKKTNWTKVARTYNVLSIEKMPIGIMTSKLAEYIYRYAIDKRKKQLKRMKNK